MNDVDYQAVYSRKLSQRGEARYIIINVTTGEILDDAQGFGYKSMKKAYAGYYYKRNYAKERETENISLFKAENIENYEEKCSLSEHQNRIENEEREEKVGFQRRR